MEEMKLKRLTRFSLGTLLLFVTAACVMLAIQRKQAIRQSQFLRAVDNVGGEVRFKHQVSENAEGRFVADPSAEPAYPRWMRNAIGDEYFQTVDQLNLIDTDADNEWLANLQLAPSLRLVMLRGSNVTGAGLTKLRHLRKLEVLDLQHRRDLTAENLEPLSGLRNLTSLDLTGCSDVSDAGLLNIAHLTRLRSLSISGSKITDKGLEHLENMTGMTHLWLGGTSVTDEGLEHLRRMEDLYWLDLRGTQVSDDGLKYLSGMRKLWQLVLWDTHVTEAGVQRLKAELPNLDLAAIGPQPH